MDADGAVLVAFLVDSEGGLVAVLMKILDPQAAGGGQPDTGIQIGFQDGAVAEIEHFITGGQALLSARLYAIPRRERGARIAEALETMNLRMQAIGWCSTIRVG
jgi:hypothetical protein